MAADRRSGAEDATAAAAADGAPAVDAGDGESRLRFTISNEYVRRDGTPQWRYPWLERNQLIEPHRLSEMAVDAPRSDGTYTWEPPAARTTASAST